MARADSSGSGRSGYRFGSISQMNTFLIHRLRNAAIAADRRRDPAMAALLTEAINELEKAQAIVQDALDPERRTA
jgi:DNA-binding ferritin-like protein